MVLIIYSFLPYQEMIGVSIGLESGRQLVLMQKDSCTQTQIGKRQVPTRTVIPAILYTHLQSKILKRTDQF